MQARAVVERDQRRAAGSLPSASAAVPLASPSPLPAASNPTEVIDLDDDNDLFGASPPPSALPNDATNDLGLSGAAMGGSAAFDSTPMMSADELNALLGSIDAPAVAPCA